MFKTNQELQNTKEKLVRKEKEKVMQKVTKKKRDIIDRQPLLLSTSQRLTP